MQYFIHVLKNYFVFTGRARRKEYWMFTLFQFLFSLAALMLDAIVDPSPAGVGLLYGVYTLALLVPSLAVGVRRLHDIGKSGWFMLVAFVPLVGGIWLLVLLCTEGTRGDNEYGPDPKQVLAY